MIDPKAVNMTAGAEFVPYVVEQHGLEDMVVPAPVEIPDAKTPRAGGVEQAAELGPLAKLPGAWIGNGFNLIARPDFQEKKPFFLELNATKEVLEFTAISGPIPNRGSKQKDISFLGLTYLQRVNEQFNNGGLHIEPGIWLSVPETEKPPAEATVVRMATIPHGNALLSQGSAFTVKGGPKIEPISSTPTQFDGKPIEQLGYLQQFKDHPNLPPGVPGEAVANPNLVLTKAIEGQKITETVVLVISTKPEGGVENIPFLNENADAISMNAIFWIETVELPNGGSLVQLQYTQTVILQFDEINWPHISVATLLKF
jgi:hypothetical protein